MACLKITESQNGQIYPEDTFSHGAAHLFFPSFYMASFDEVFYSSAKL